MAISLLLCIAALVGCFIAARRSLVSGLCALLLVGYLYGIIRANLPNTVTYFLFDASVASLYLGVWFRPFTRLDRYRTRELLSWMVFLVGWPCLLFLIPIQNQMVQLLGLRSAVFFLPFALLGAMMDARQIYKLALWVAVLDLLAFAFAGLEFGFGIEPFYPLNAVTALVYSWKLNFLQGEYSTLPVRIPSTFAASAQYGMAMVLSMPLLWGALMQRHARLWHGWLLMAAIVAASVGTFISASRTQTILIICALMFAMLSGGVRFKFALAWMAAVAITICAVVLSPRLQRITTLEQPDYVSWRVGLSLNEKVVELAQEYPLGNGLGGGGTSLPYFLAADRPVQLPGLENDYVRIMLEEGLPGLLLWLAFIGWVFLRRPAKRSDPWKLGRRLAWFCCAVYFATAWIGIGLFVSIPGAAMLFLLIGWMVAPQPIGYRLRAVREFDVRGAKAGRRLVILGEEAVVSARRSGSESAQLESPIVLHEDAVVRG